MHTEVIAELGSCHGGSLARAHDLVWAAYHAGADTVKLQYWSSAERMAARRQVPAYYREFYETYRIPAAWLDVLSAHAAFTSMRFLCTVYLPEDVDVVARRSDRLKVSSFEAQDRALLAAAQAARPVIVSTGMQTATERADTVRLLRPGDACLHCVSAYPAPEGAMQLATVRWLEQARPEGVAVGLSDHSVQLDMGAMAVAAGAQIVEVHLRHDDTDPSNPDYASALSQTELAEYIAAIRRAEHIVGEAGPGDAQPAEAAMAQYRVRS